ncbi:MULTISPECIES: LapA family protein [Pseudoxanthomonas]|jgi:lipopolysaccharide assembly protein A|uniref:LapA family protein n=1 Tax=Pseudoxanthomonas TaxID=83618 RepID=UPI00160DFA54|nr:MULTISPECIES: LapA family protein [Pseudoxanthomonas]MBB3274475.1 putative integral membrane protein [Pseudoxanthomonas sp. OG2]MBV7474981.1 LapA family protein [Pseudoxanthomonas sp. PXM05]UBB27072.1 LapA family protein [Pseudoxanthomonas japonensis]
MSTIRLVVALVFLAAGLVIGVLNTQPIVLKLLFTEIPTSSGVAIILSLLFGVLIGGLIVMATMVLPLYARLRKANKVQASAASSSIPPTPGMGP